MINILSVCDCIVFYRNGNHLDLHVLTHSFPTRRSSDLSTVFRWLRDEAHEEFRQQYARARDNQADTLADEILDIADDGSNDYVGEDEKYNGDAVARSRLRVDARKWLAGKLAPKKYGEKIDHTLANPDGSPVVFQTIFEKKPEA